MATTYTAHHVRTIAVLARVDPRTVKRYLLGLPTREGGAERIRKAIEKVKAVK